MKILVVNIDSTIPNIALKKIEMYHKEKGDTVYMDLPMYASQCDRIYASCVFEKNKWMCEEWEAWKAIIGGSGYDLNIHLPPEIDAMKPKINIGFTSRGCVRRCEFCVVPQKEGVWHPTGDIYDFWDGKSRNIRLLDNNPFAVQKHFYMITDQIIKEKLKVYFDGLDARLLDEGLAKRLAEMRHEDYHFAFDNMKDEEAVRKAVKLLMAVGLSRNSFYVLVGFNTEPNQDLYRMNVLKSINQNPFVQRYNDKKDKVYQALASWGNVRAYFQAMSFKEFCEMPEHKRAYRDWFKVTDEGAIELLQPLKA